MKIGSFCFSTLPGRKKKIKLWTLHLNDDIFIPVIGELLPYELMNYSSNAFKSSFINLSSYKFILFLHNVCISKLVVRTANFAFKLTLVNSVRVV